LSITNDIPIYRINDDSENIDLLQKAADGAKVLSQESAIGLLIQRMLSRSLSRSRRKEK
jgi:hypothetical protein